jgi:hypothetical protein
MKGDGNFSGLHSRSTATEMAIKRAKRANVDCRVVPRYRQFVVGQIDIDIHQRRPRIEYSDVSLHTKVKHPTQNIADRPRAPTFPTNGNRSAYVIAPVSFRTNNGWWENFCPSHELALGTGDQREKEL